MDLEVILQSPFYLVQIWVWERFRNLQPQPNLINEGDPVLAKWHKVKALKVDNVRFSLNLAMEDFVWRPYVRYAAKWRIFYPENEMWVLDFETGLDIELLSFVTCLRSSELVGIDSSIKQYLPHRVSMQFGMDQDLPGCVPRFDQTKAIAWENYCRPICDENLSIPSRLFEADVTMGYVKWWKQSVFNHPVKKIERRKRSARRFPNGASKENRNGSDADAPPGFPPKLFSTSISGKRYGDASITRKGDNDADAPSDRLPKHLKTVTFGNFDLDSLVASDDIDADIPTGFSRKYNTLNHYNSVEKYNPDLGENQSGGRSHSLGNVTAYECEHLSNQCSSAYTSDHGDVQKLLSLPKIYEEDNIKGSIRVLNEDFEDGNGSKESRFSTERASLSGTKDEDNSDSSKTNAEELEHRINKLEADFEQRIKKLQIETTKLMKATRFGHT
ncbi:putative aminotransferase-like, plant mobile domain-containing protein [Lupinus albus]|uniref:Putative aminotransferase-like, plant mobile domain-containing protein n=1 Tax=Lupinus albus TaxID=3870 RepID=A0A6A4R239_LUPAL|nr:putative aminotransferase-like, plant mobile domain-containing protein [Lupinus albus]